MLKANRPIGLLRVKYVGVQLSAKYINYRHFLMCTPTVQTSEPLPKVQPHMCTLIFVSQQKQTSRVRPISDPAVWRASPKWGIWGMRVAPGSQNSSSAPYTAHPCLTVHTFNEIYLINFTMRKIRNHLLLFLFYFCLFVLPGSEEDVLILLTDNVAVGTRKENTILCQLLEEKKKGSKCLLTQPNQKLLLIHTTVCLSHGTCMWNSSLSLPTPKAHKVPSVARATDSTATTSTRGYKLLNTRNMASAGHQSLSAATKPLYIHWVWVAAVEIKPRDGLSAVDVQLPRQSVQVWESQLHAANG